MRSAVICAVDKSDIARVVRETATWAAERLGARLLLTHVVPPASGFTHGHPTLEHKKRLADTADAEGLLESLDVDGQSERRILYGDPVTELARLAEHESAELVVAGTRGHGPVKATVIGSVARELLREALCPVLVVPPATDEARIRKGTVPGRTLVCGVDFSSESAAAARTAKRFSERLGLELVVAHASAPLNPNAPRARPGLLPSLDLSLAEQRLASAIHQEFDDFLDRVLGDDARSVRRRVINGLPVEALREAAEEEDAALAVVGHRGLGRTKSLLVGSVARDLVASAAVPVVVVRDRPGKSAIGRSTCPAVAGV